MNQCPIFILPRGTHRNDRFSLSFRPKGGQRQPAAEKPGLERKTIIVRSQMSGKPRGAAEIPVCDIRYTTYETCGELVESIRDFSLPFRFNSVDSSLASNDARHLGFMLHKNGFGTEHRKRWSSPVFIMKRDWELIREVLIRLDEKGAQTHALKSEDFGEENRGEIVYQVELLKEAGLVDASIIKTMSEPPDFVAFRLTWNGHELLDAIQDETVWNRTKDSFISKGLSMTFDLVKSVAISIATEILKSKIGG